MHRVVIAIFFMALLLGFSACSTTEGLPTLETMIIFGDDNSDGGAGANGLFVITDGAEPPSPPYWEGRLTNGLIYSDWLYGFLGIPYNPTENNFAVAGATSGLPNITTGLPDGLLGQVQSYLEDHPSIASNCLSLLFAGGNNFLVPGIDPITVIPNALDELAQAVGLLANAGAQYIVISNIPSYGRAPFAQPLGLRDILDFLSFTFNEKLVLLVDQLKLAHPGITFFLVNSFEFQFGAILMPELFGFTNVTDPCLLNGQICDTPDQYLYWDEKNFSRIFHQAWATWFADTICADPQPFSNCDNLALLEEL